MEKSVQITGIIVLGVIIVAVIGFFGFSNLSSSNNVVSSTGEARIEVLPDNVGIYFSVKTSADTSKEATEDNAEIVESLINNLVDLGIEREEIQTQNFNVYPKYVWSGGARREDGYEATHNLKVGISADDSSKIGEIIDAGVSAGAAINRISWELTQESQNNYKAEAIKLAAEDARIKAESIAEGLGKNLGRVVSTSESSFGYSPWLIYEDSVGAGASGAKVATTNIQPSEQEIYASVRATFKIS